MGKIILINKRARYDYQVLEQVEAGIQLTGAEVKSLRLGRGALADARVVFMADGAWVLNINIPGYQFADLRDYDPIRSRKLLLHKKQLISLKQKSEQSGCSVIPLVVKIVNNRIKLDIALVRGKKIHEKREVIRKRDLDREVRRDYKLRVH